LAGLPAYALLLARSLVLKRRWQALLPARWQN
jgi:hypothetical protein